MEGEDRYSKSNNSVTHWISESDKRNGTFICMVCGCFVNSKDANVTFVSQLYIFVSKHENTMSFLSEKYQWSNSRLDLFLTTTYGIPSHNILVNIRLYKLQINWSDIAASSDHFLLLALQEKNIPRSAFEGKGQCKYIGLENFVRSIY